MKSIAVWYKPKKSDDTIPPAEMHFNLWKFPVKKGKKFKRFLDIGLKLGGFNK
jgi:hypothetical protein